MSGNNTVWVLSKVCGSDTFDKNAIENPLLWEDKIIGVYSDYHIAIGASYLILFDRYVDFTGRYGEKLYPFPANADFTYMEKFVNEHNGKDIILV